MSKWQESSCEMMGSDAVRELVCEPAKFQIGGGERYRSAKTLQTLCRTGFVRNKSPQFVAVRIFETLLMFRISYSNLVAHFAPKPARISHIKSFLAIWCSFEFPRARSVITRCFAREETFYATWHCSETGQIRFRRVRFQTPNSVSFLALTEFQGDNSASCVQPIICVSIRTHQFFSQNSPSSLQNSVSSLFRNSTLGTVFHPFPNCWDNAKCRNSNIVFKQGKVVSFVLLNVWKKCCPFCPYYSSICGCLYLLVNQTFKSQTRGNSHQKLWYFSVGTRPLKLQFQSFWMNFRDHRLTGGMAAGNLSFTKALTKVVL